MKNQDYTNAIAVTGIFSILFLYGFTFNLTASPQLLMLMGIASMGYMLILLGIGSTTHNLRTKIYILFGLIFISLSLLSALALPHSTPLFF